MARPLRFRVFRGASRRSQVDLAWTARQASLAFEIDCQTSDLVSSQRVEVHSLLSQSDGALNSIGGGKTLNSCLDCPKSCVRSEIATEKLVELRCDNGPSLNGIGRPRSLLGHQASCLGIEA